MRGILYKELVLSKARVIFLIAAVLFISIVGIAMVADNPNPDEGDAAFMSIMLSTPVFMSFFYVNILTPEIFKRDENRTWPAFAASTPQTLKGHLQGRYLFILLLNMFVLFVWHLASFVIMALTNGMISPALAAFASFVIFLMLNGIEIPFMVRYGSSKGAAIKGIIFGLAALAVIIYGLFGDISFLFGDNPVKAVMDFLNGGTMVWALAVFPYIAAAIYIASYFISLKLYPKGAENYEQ